MERSAIDSILYSGPAVSVGQFRCPTEHPNFCDSGPIRDHMFVLPRTSVRISHSGRRPVVADRTTVMFYNRAQTYRREPVSRRGDLCDWFQVRADLIVDAVERFDPTVADRPDQPFTFRRGPMSLRVFDDTLRFVARLETTSTLAVEERVLQWLNGVVSASYTSRAKRPRRSRGSERDLAEEARRLIAERYAEALTLDDLAHQLASSPFHLARAFRRETGMTLHRYRTEIRLRAALDQLVDGVEDLSRLAHDLGFSSHSHFTDSFRRWHGQTPSEVRAEALGRVLSVDRKVGRERSVQ